MIAPVGYLLESFKRAFSGRVAESEWYVATAGDAELRAQNVRVSLGSPR
jgi:hypothetical protein